MSNSSILELDNYDPIEYARLQRDSNSESDYYDLPVENVSLEQVSISGSDYYDPPARHVPLQQDSISESDNHGTLVENVPLEQVSISESDNYDPSFEYVPLEQDSSFKSENYDPPVKYVLLDHDSVEFRILKKFLNNSSYYKLRQAERVENRHLSEIFDHMNYSLYRHIKPTLLFHGTKSRNVDHICMNNFSKWHTPYRGRRYGEGVYFSSKLKHALNFTDKSCTKVVIVADVLVRNTTFGHRFMLAPPVGYDTTVSPDEKTIIKFFDNEYIPRYILYIKHVRPINRNRNRIRKFKRMARYNY